MKSVRAAVEFLTDNLKYATQEQLDQLRNLLLSPSEIQTEGGFNILAEVEAQMKLVKDLRNRVETSTLSVRDVGELVGSSTKLFTMLTRMRTEIINQDRLRKIEAATLETIKNLSPDLQDRFFSDLAKRLP